MLLVTILSLLPVFPTLEIPSCIKYETYLTTQYGIRPLEFSDSWFKHSIHFSPRKITRLNIRSKRVFGCCEGFGFEYEGFPTYRCRPVCFGGCQMDAHCTAPNQCTCDRGYYKDTQSELCISNDTLISGKLLETSTAEVSTETASSKAPCNGSCPSNEVCSAENDVCICRNGFQRQSSNESSGCVPECKNGCLNGDCTSPNTCTCWPHYERTNDTSCHLKCSELTCTFGECNENGTCICAEGFFNNGTSCLWAGDDIFSEPDYCECWSKFEWQKNVTNGRCLQSCDDNEDNPDKLTDCIPFRECEFYEGFTICHTQMFKCIEVPPAAAPTAISFEADKANEDIVITNQSTGMIFLAVGLILLLSIVVSGVWIWNIRRSWLSRLWSYSTMENAHEDQQV